MIMRYGQDDAKAKVSNPTLQEILGKSLNRYRKYLCGPVPTDLMFGKKEPYDRIKTELVQAISAAMKAAKPEKHKKYPDYKWTEWDDGYNAGVDAYEANLNTFLGGGNG